MIFKKFRDEMQRIENQNYKIFTTKTIKSKEKSDNSVESSDFQSILLHSFISCRFSCHAAMPAPIPDISYSDFTS